LAAKLLGVALRAQPCDAALAVHPLVDFRFAFETRDLNRLDTRTFGPLGYISAGFMSIGGSLSLGGALIQIKCSKG
jgi:hypothetical protein